MDVRHALILTSCGSGSPSARRVVFYAQEDAQRFGEGYVSTEHILLGLVRDRDSTAREVLERFGLPIQLVRAEVEKQLRHGDSRPSQDMTLTPRAKRVIDLAYDEARSLNNNYIGTEHLLLGLIREGDGLAGRVLAKLGVELEKTREVVTQIQAESRPAPAPSEQVAAGPSLRTEHRLPQTAGLLLELLRNRQDRQRVDRLCALLLTETYGAAAAALRKLQLAPDEILTLIEMQLLRQVATAEAGGRQTPLSAVLDLANEEALSLSQPVNSAHLLLAALRAGNCLTSVVLTDLGVTVDSLRAALQPPSEEGAG